MRAFDAVAGFTYTGLPARIVFGTGTLLRVPDEVARLGAGRALVLSTPHQESLAASVADLLGSSGAGLFTGAAMHTPVDVTDQAMRVVRERSVDCVVAVGGGSTIGLGKAIALRTGLPQIAVPTTYAGSEVTPILGQTEGGAKTTLRTLDVLPEVVVYDVALTMTLPAAMTATSGMNAIAHAVEALYAKDRNPIVSLMAREAIAALGRALPRIVRDSGDVGARSDALYGAWLAGTCLGAVGMSLHHKLCHVLGGMFDLPHSETHAVVLPHAVAYNAAAAPDAMRVIAEALGARDAAGGLHDLNRALGCPASLASLGMPADGIDRAADSATKNPYWSPRPVERAAIRDLLARAHAGEPPSGERRRDAVTEEMHHV